MARTPISTIAQYAPCTINIRGKVAFSRLRSRIEGQELEAQNREAQAKGRIQHTKPYVFITINNPMIVDSGTLPPQVKQVIQERFFKRQDGTMGFTQESKSPYLPTILYSMEAGELKGQGIANNDVPLQAEFASGLDVTIGVDLYVMKGAFNNAGLGIKYILVNEPVKYFTASNSLESELAAQGIKYVAPTAAPVAPVSPIAQTAQVQQPVYSAPAVPTYTSPAMEQFAGGYAQPTPTPYTQPAPTPYTQPQQQVYVQPQMPNVAIEDIDIPFNQGSAPMSLGAEPKVERPVRFY